jgi:CHAT domain-containing protein
VETPYFHRLEEEGRIELWDWQREMAAETKAAGEMERRSAFVRFSREHESEVAHFACHAVADPDYGVWSWLELEPGLEVRLADLSAEDYLLGGRPVVVLNACGTGVRDPRRTWDFVREFMVRGGRGALATECDVPDEFAAVFIQRVYDEALKGETFGRALLGARKYFWERYGNPLGLLYAAYVRLETRIVPGEE